MARPSSFLPAVVLAVVLVAGSCLAACSGDGPTANDDPIDGFCLAVIDVDAAMRDLADGTDPGPGLDLAADQLDRLPEGALRDHATVVHRRLELVAAEGIGPTPAAEQADLRAAFSAVSAECTSRGHPVDLLQGFSAA